MDMGSSSNDSLNGLTFGKKIYFEDGGGNSCKVSSKKGGGQQQQPPRCQVEGCNMDLTGAKAYYCRHKVCGMHSKSPKVIVAGLEQRFCQQCSRFHQLPEFDQGKRSCRRRLAGHNERRRKPPPGSLSARIGRLSSSFHGGFLMDFAYPRLPGPSITNSGRDVWPTIRAGDRVAGIQWQGGALFSAAQIPSDSSCALSLLSTQPWGSTSMAITTTAAASSMTSALSSEVSFSGAALAQPATTSSCVKSLWGFKGHEVRHEMGLGPAMGPGDGRFSGELELALQGSSQRMEPYGHSSDLVNWSL